MKLFINIVLISAALLLSTNSFAAKPLSEGQALSQCRALANTQFNNVKRTRLTHMKTTRGQFKAKIRVSSATDAGLFLCTIERNQEAQIVRLDKDITAVATK